MGHPQVDVFFLDMLPILSPINAQENDWFSSFIQWITSGLFSTKPFPKSMLILELIPAKNRVLSIRFRDILVSYLSQRSDPYTGKTKQLHWIDPGHQQLLMVKQ